MAIHSHLTPSGLAHQRKYIHSIGFTYGYSHLTPSGLAHQRKFIMKTLLFVIILTATQTVLAFGQQTTGACSPIFVNSTVGKSVTIKCQGVPAAAMAELNKMLDSAKTNKRLNQLLDIVEQDLQTTQQELQRTQLTVQEKIQIAENWARKYKDLEERLALELGEELAEQAYAALENGQLKLAGSLLDKLISKREQQVDKLAANHYNRAKVYELQFNPVRALPHLAKAYRYQPENMDYAHAYAVLLQEQNNFQQATLIYATNLHQLRKLAQANPNAYEPSVATTLNNLALLYRETSRYKEAEAHSLEALTLYRKLAQANPNAYEPYVALTLNNLAILYSETSRYKEAEAHYLEALKIRRKLAQANPNAYEPSVAGTLNNLAILYRETSRYKEAEAHYLEALTLYRKLAQANPNAYEPDVAMTLNNLALFYLKQGNLPTVRKYTSEALPICRRWYKKYPKVFGKKLAITLTLKGMATIDKKTNSLSRFSRSFNNQPARIHKAIGA